MALRRDDTTPGNVALVGGVYDALVALGDTDELGPHTARMRKEFQRRTGAFGAEDPWFEPRARAFWDDAVATQGFGLLAARELDERARAVAACIARAHRGFFLVEEVDDRGARLVDAWSGAELVVRHIDEAQAMTLEHAEGPMDGRVTASPDGADLWLLPGAFHHAADALDPALDVLVAARERGMTTQQALDALLRMELVFRASSRVKAAFAYRTTHLDAAATGEVRT